MKSLQINGIPFYYEDELLSHETIKPITVESGKKTLEICKKLLEERNIPIYLTFGTLLGAVRDHSIIKGDEDVDVFVEGEKPLLDSLPYLSEHGMKLIRVLPGRVYSFRLNGDCFIDVYILKRNVKSVWSFYCVYLNGLAMPKKYFREYQEISFLGGNYKCVANPENLLAFWYGKTWRVPVRNHKFYYEVLTAYFWHNKTRIIKSLIQHCIGWYHWRHLVKPEHSKK